MLHLIDALAGAWLDWRMAQAVKHRPELFKFKRADLTEKGLTVQGVSPVVAMLADQAVTMLQAANAKNYIEFDMLPRADRGVRPIRITVQWVHGESPAQKAARLERELSECRERQGGG